MGSILIQKPPAEGKEEGGSTEILKVFRHFQSHCGLKVRTVPYVAQPRTKESLSVYYYSTFHRKDTRMFPGNRNL